MKMGGPSAYWSSCFMCGVKASGSSDVCFHKFPSDIIICTLWKQVCNLTAVDDISTLKICSRHFKQEDYVKYTGYKFGKLKAGTVPSIGVPNPLVSTSVIPKNTVTNHPSNEKNNTSVSVCGRLSNKHPIADSADSSTNSVKRKRKHSSQQFDPKRLHSQTPRVRASLKDSGNASDHSSTVSTSTDSFIDVESDFSSPKSIPETMSNGKTSQKLEVCIPQKSPRSGKRGPLVRPQSAFKDGEPRVVLERLGSSGLNKYLRREENIKALPLSVIVREEIVVSHPDAGDSNLEGNPNVCYVCNNMMSETVSLHKFPTRKSVRKEWIRVCQLQDDEDVSCRRICSQHFMSEDYEVTYSKLFGYRKTLYRDAVPSVNLRQPFRGVIVSKPDAGKTNLKKDTAVCCLCKQGIDESVSLFWFPTSPALCIKWMKACGMVGQYDVSRLKICSQHFRPDDFVKCVAKPLPGRLKLQVGAVPSVKIPCSDKKSGDLADVKIKKGISISKDSQMWDASNLLEVIVDESSQPMYFDSEDLRHEERSNKVQKTCFLCGAKEEGKIFSPKALHKFPDNEDLRMLWKRVCNINDHDYMKTSSLLICSNHFSEDDYVVGTKLPGRTPVLKPEAVPQIDVPCPRHREVSHPLSTEEKPFKKSTSSNSSYITEVIIETEITVKEESLLSSDEEVKIENSDSRAMVNSPILTSQTCPSLRVKNVSQLLSKNVNDSMEAVQNSEQLTPNPLISEKNSDIGRVDTSVNDPLTDPLFVPESSTPAQSATHESNLPVITSVYHASSFPATSPNDPLAPNPASHPLSKPSTHILYMPANVNLSQVLPTVKIPFVFSNLKLQAKTNNQSPVFKIKEPVSQNDIPNTQNVAKPTNAGNYLCNFESRLEFIGSASQASLPQPQPPPPPPQPPSLPQLAPQTQLQPKPQFVKVFGKSSETLPQRKLPTSSSGAQIGNNYIVGRSINTFVESSAPKVVCELRKPERTNEIHEDPTLPPVAKRNRLSEGVPDRMSPNSSLSGEPSLKTYQNELNNALLTLEQIKRIKRSVRSFDDLLIHLQKRDMLSKDAADILTTMVTNKSKSAIIKRLDMTEFKWNDDLKSFALTLHLLSGEAFSYVNRLWPSIFVPDVSVVRYWSKVKGGRPGFCSEILDALFLTKNVLCNVSISEMSLRQEMLFANERFYGGIDLGSYEDMQNDNMVPAQNALIFFVNSLVSSWRVPVGYFLIKSLNAKERANILVRCLELLNEVGVVVLSVTIDGSLVNTSMCRHLGANFSYGVNFQPWFLHPVTRDKIFVFWDPCCMIKLARDTLGDKGTLIDYKHTLIRWSFFKELVKVKSDDLQNVDMKLTDTHVNYQKNRDDLKLCLQTFSRSVYKGFMTAIVKNLPQFRGADNTAMFCLMLNDIFDMLNCKNRFTTRLFQHPISGLVFAALRQSASACIEYIQGLTDECGIGILKTPRKTGFVGFIICLTNMFELYNSGKKFGLTFLFTNKLSLDYARAFSCVMQGNKQRLLNAKEFEERFKNIFLKRKDVFEKTDILMDGIQILKVLSQKDHYKDPVCNYQMEKHDKMDVYDYFKGVPTFWSSSENDIKYIGGFVVGKILKMNVCSLCARHLTSNQETRLLTLERCTRPRVYYVPTEDVCKICKTAERMLRENKNVKLKLSNVNFFVIKTFGEVFQTVFHTNEMSSHIMEQDSLDNHRTQLCKLIAETFLKMRIIHES